MSAIMRHATAVAAAPAYVRYQRAPSRHTIRENEKLLRRTWGGGGAGMQTATKKRQGHTCLAWKT